MNVDKIPDSSNFQVLILHPILILQQVSFSCLRSGTD